MPLQAKRVLNQFRYAMYFNGTNAYVRIPDNTSLRITNDITLIATVYPFNANLWGAIITGRQITYFLAVSYNSFRFYLSHDYSTWFVLAGNTGGGMPPIPAQSSIWQMVAGSYTSSSGSYKAFVNGNLATSGSVTPQTIALNDKGVVIGGAYASSPATYWFQGYIFNVMIYSRYLSDSEIQYNYQNLDNPVTNGLVLWLQADPQYIQGNTWIDLSGNGNNGTIYNAQLVQLEKTSARILDANRILKVIR